MHCETCPLQLVPPMAILAASASETWICIIYYSWVLQFIDERLFLISIHRAEFTSICVPYPTVTSTLGTITECEMLRVLYVIVFPLLSSRTYVIMETFETIDMRNMYRCVEYVLLCSSPQRLEYSIQSNPS